MAMSGTSGFAGPTSRRRGAMRRAALVAGVTIGATAVSFATVVGYASYNDVNALRFGAVERSEQSAAERVNAEVRAVLGDVQVARLDPRSVSIAPSAADEIALRVDSTLELNRDAFEAQLSRIEELQRIAVSKMEVAPLAGPAPVAAPTPAPALLSLGAIAALDAADALDRMADLALPSDLAPIG